MANDSAEFMKDVLATPLGELISSIGAGVAEAQAALDAGSLSQTLAIYNSENKDALTALMREVGYQPTFYALPETEVEAQISLSLSVTGQAGSAAPGQSNNLAKTRIYATPANASSTNRFNLAVNAFSKIKFKIVPVPPPGESADIRVVPDLLGKTSDEADVILRQLGLNYTVVASTAGGRSGTTPTLTASPVVAARTVKSQSPAAGAIIKASAPIEISF